MGAALSQTCDDDRAAALISLRRHGDPHGARAEHWLRHVSYYRLSAYQLPFEYPKGNPGPGFLRAPASIPSPSCMISTSPLAAFQ